MEVTLLKGELGVIVPKWVVPNFFTPLNENFSPWIVFFFYFFKESNDKTNFSRWCHVSLVNMLRRVCESGVVWSRKRLKSSFFTVKMKKFSFRYHMYLWKDWRFTWRKNDAALRPNLFVCRDDWDYKLRDEGGSIKCAEWAYAYQLRTLELPTLRVWQLRAFCHVPPFYLEVSSEIQGKVRSW